MTAPRPTTTTSEESVEQFAARAAEWLAENMPRIDPADPPRPDRSLQETWQRARDLQARLYAGGFAGICFPREYGGLGLTYDYQKAFDAQTRGYEMPIILNNPTFSICSATILDTGTEEQKRQHIPAVLRGDEVLVQLLSEPSGGSDLAGLITRADRRDGTWVINGAKCWSSSAFAADYGLMLARTDWTVPKHDGLTMFLVPMDSPGLTLRRIKQVNESDDFCEEFFDDLALGDDAVLGEVNGGWAAASCLLQHEKRTVGGGSEFASGIGNSGTSDQPADYAALARATGQADDVRVHELAGRALVRRTVRDQLIEHVSAAIRNESLPPAAVSLIRVFSAEAHQFEVDTAMTIAGTAAVVDDGDGLFDINEPYLMRQAGSLGGGTTEIARNVIGERLLGFPREQTADRGVAFKDVRTNSI
jgi:alkylation response protein AidB-like acyl-CoA dehydrogenase